MLILIVMSLMLILIIMMIIIEKAIIVKVDHQTDPPSYAIKTSSDSRELNTERNRLTLTNPSICNRDTRESPVQQPRTNYSERTSQGEECHEAKTVGAMRN